jgi:hypothetical protein
VFIPCWPADDAGFERATRRMNFADVDRPGVIGPGKSRAANRPDFIAAGWPYAKSDVNIGLATQQSIFTGEDRLESLEPPVNCGIDPG